MSFPPRLPLLGSLQSLVFTGHVSYDIEKWARYTDFTNLRRLTTSWSLECGVYARRFRVSRHARTISN
jgi:hypothetical protein